MNNTLELKGKIYQSDRKIFGGGRKLPKGKFLDKSRILSLVKDLEFLSEYWREQDIFDKVFISVHYNCVIAKSNRISKLLSSGRSKPNASIVGAKFNESDGELKHIVTHYVDYDVIERAKKLLESLYSILDHYNIDRISEKDLKNENIVKFELKLDEYGLSKTTFKEIIVDAYYVESFRVPTSTIESDKNSIISIYKTDMKILDLLAKLGIRVSESKVIDETTVLLLPNELELLLEKAPYLISMGVTDISEIPEFDFEEASTDFTKIPDPTSEPFIGVIDTHFDDRVYFSNWVEYINLVDKDIELTPNDFKHGTAVTSIIVDGPNINSHLDDGCGRFRVRHFGVATSGKFSSFSIIKSILKIINENKDIKVWNLSLGSIIEVKKNFISPEAALLDKIQTENDVIFVISGTNNNSDERMRIGAPADSINSLVVNSVNFENVPASYSRVGPVLSFFQKPDISYYGGTKENPMRVCTSTGESFVTGTSFAAPWIARKMAYLINILGFTREAAKALIIHSSTSWNKPETDPMIIGYGIVPININEIIKSKDDEIQIVLNGVSEKYNSYTYNLPVPRKGNMHPFIAKATMCYFPYCSRNQGVDYTNTEFDLYFGVIDDNNKIKTVNQNKQIDYDGHYTKEIVARQQFRKWDNVKYISEFHSPVKRAKKSNESGKWGISVKTKERLDEKFGENIKFGIVITLKELNGVNRCEEFIKECQANGWFVNAIDVEQKIDIYNILEEEIEDIIN